MAAITPSAVVPDTVYGQQFRQGGQFLAFPFSIVSDAAPTWTVPTGINPINVAWKPDTASDIVAPTLSAGVITFDNDGLATYSGTLIVVQGGEVLMAAITPSTFTADTAFAQRIRHGGQVLVFPFTAGTADSWTTKGMSAFAVAWQPTTSADQVAVTLGVVGATGGRTITFNGVGAGLTGNLIVFTGGVS